MTEEKKELLDDNENYTDEKGRAHLRKLLKSLKAQENNNEKNKEKITNPVVNTIKSLKPTLHIVYQGGSFELLKLCLKNIKKEDALLLLGDAVNVFTDTKLAEEISNVSNLYSCEQDLLSRGIKLWYGQSVSAKDIVELTVKYGSPLTWK